jgi:hypothetical protein
MRNREEERSWKHIRPVFDTAWKDLEEMFDQANREQV